MFDRRWHTGIERGLEPVGTALRRTGVSADHLTAGGLVMAAAASVAVGTGRLGLGLALLIASSLPDLLDGAVAKASHTASDRGAFFDSVADRVSDNLVLGGVAWYLATTRPGPLAVLPFAVAAASTLVSYERARAESLGYSGKGGLMERAERVVAVAFGLAFHAVLVPVLFVILALTLVTVVQRFVMVWRQASVTRPVPTPPVTSRPPLSPERWSVRRTSRPRSGSWRRRVRTRP